MTKQQFAELSFERDRVMGMYPRRMPWKNLPDDEKQIYLEEAELYLKMPTSEWPIDILKKLSVV